MRVASTTHSLAHASASSHTPAYPLYNAVRHCVAVVEFNIIYTFLLFSFVPGLSMLHMSWASVRFWHSVCFHWLCHVCFRFGFFFLLFLRFIYSLPQRAKNLAFCLRYPIFVRAPLFWEFSFWHWHAAWIHLRPGRRVWVEKVAQNNFELKSPNKSNVRTARRYLVFVCECEYACRSATAKHFAKISAIFDWNKN